jgi:hypothetical protein
MPSASTTASLRAAADEPVQRHTAISVPTATATSTYVNIRLPNSMTPCMPSARCGTNDSSVHRGQVGQPRPELVSLTRPPVSTISVLAMTDAQAHRSTVLRSGVRRADFTPIGTSSR